MLARPVHQMTTAGKLDDSAHGAGQSSRQVAAAVQQLAAGAVNHASASEQAARHLHQLVQAIEDVSRMVDDRAVDAMPSGRAGSSRAVKLAPATPLRRAG